MRTHSSRAWIGHWLLAVALLHTLASALWFGPTLQAMWQQGLFNTVGADALRGAVSWFVLFGVLLALLAMAITPLERAGQAPALRRLGWGTMALTALGLLLMPLSGFWLALPAALALLRKR
ncbi:hypothetical protein HNP55_000130 [Paucibacter oligotrophus]|uniref:Uncharacterized protein n=1 Tax=Roseateles oligotrophus TaxID=1769250 RepID=A0A840L526_9BURK|nr:DUF6463 family protein [Roseateles oligotrophus]MBB4841635.1 hypothetical protein [Roseateles oligotrophus]